MSEVAMVEQPSTLLLSSGVEWSGVRKLGSESWEKEITGYVNSRCGFGLVCLATEVQPAVAF